MNLTNNNGNVLTLYFTTLDVESFNLRKTFWNRFPELTETVEIFNNSKIEAITLYLKNI